MSKTTTMHFTYDPLNLVRLVLDIYAESLEGLHTKAIQFARYEFLRTMTDEELKRILNEYVDKENLEEINLSDPKKDGERIFKYIYESERYKALEFKFNKSGYGSTGLGVVDKLDNTFYDCALAHHWEKIMTIVKQKYPHFNRALEEMYIDEKLNEFEGVTREQLDNFISETFELVGAGKSLNSYIS